MKNEYRLCSVVVTSYNQESTIAQTLDCILAQVCDFSYEIIIGDDCSTDSTKEICAKYKELHPEKIKLVFHDENLGVAGNFATCCKLASGKYISVCAADDYWHNPAKLKLQVEFMEQNSNCGLLYTDYNKLDIRTGKIIKDFLKNSNSIPLQGNNLINDFFIGNVPVLTLTVMFRKSLFNQFIPADDYIKFRFPIEDWPTWLILSKYSSVCYLPISTSTYRVGHESITNPVSYEKIEKRMQSEHRMYKYICDMFPDDINYDESGYLSYMNNIYLNLAYKKFDFPKSSLYAKKLKMLGSENRQVKMSSNPITFYLLACAKYLKHCLLK